MKELDRVITAIRVLDQRQPGCAVPGCSACVHNRQVGQEVRDAVIELVMLAYREGDEHALEKSPAKRGDLARTFENEVNQVRFA